MFDPKNTDGTAQRAARVLYLSVVAEHKQELIQALSEFYRDYERNDPPIVELRAWARDVCLDFQAVSGRDPWANSRWLLDAALMVLESWKLQGREAPLPETTISLPFTPSGTQIGENAVFEVKTPLDPANFGLQSPRPGVLPSHIWKLNGAYLDADGAAYVPDRESRAEARTRLKNAFDAWLERYLEKVEAEHSSAGWDSVPVKYNVGRDEYKHFRWLRDWHVQHRTYQDIADRARVSRDAVKKRLRPLKRLIFS